MRINAAELIQTSRIPAAIQIARKATVAIVFTIEAPYR